MPYDIRLDTDMPALVAAFEVERPTMDLLDAHLGDLFQAARASAPRKTGKYMRSFRYRRSLTAGGQHKAEIVNDDPKSFYVHGGRHAQELFRAGDEVADRVLALLAQQWGAD